MAMDGAQLGQQVRAAIAGVSRPPDDADQSELDAFHDELWDAICTAVVTHIQSQATIVGLAVTGVTGGPSTSGPNVGGNIV